MCQVSDLGIWVVGNTFFQDKGRKSTFWRRKISVLNLLCLKHVQHNQEGELVFICRCGSGSWRAVWYSFGNKQQIKSSFSVVLVIAARLWWTRGSGCEVWKWKSESMDSSQKKFGYEKEKKTREQEFINMFFKRWERTDLIPLFSLQIFEYLFSTGTGHIVVSNMDVVLCPL